MRMDIKALSLTVAIVWGGSILLIGLANLIWTTYGVAFLEVAASIYPGYRGGSSFGQATPKPEPGMNGSTSGCRT